MEQKRGEGKQRFYKEGNKLGLEVSALKAGLELPYELCCSVKEQKNGPKLQKLSMSHPYLRMHTYERDFWYTCIK